MAYGYTTTAVFELFVTIHVQGFLKIYTLTIFDRLKILRMRKFLNFTRESGVPHFHQVFHEYIG